MKRLITLVTILVVSISLIQCSSSKKSDQKSETKYKTLAIYDQKVPQFEKLLNDLKLRYSKKEDILPDGTSKTVYALTNGLASMEILGKPEIKSIFYVFSPSAKDIENLKITGFLMSGLKVFCNVNSEEEGSAVLKNLTEGIQRQKYIFFTNECGVGIEKKEGLLPVIGVYIMKR